MFVTCDTMKQKEFLCLLQHIGWSLQKLPNRKFTEPEKSQRGESVWKQFGTES